MGKFDLAEPLYVEAKTILENAFGKVHPGYASNLNLLAGLYLNLDKLEEAEELYLESNAIWEKVSGREHPNYANGLNDLDHMVATTKEIYENKDQGPLSEEESLARWGYELEYAERPSPAVCWAPTSAMGKRSPAPA